MDNMTLVCYKNKRFDVYDLPRKYDKWGFGLLKTRNHHNYQVNDVFIVGPDNEKLYRITF